ncbi:hypothetical protein [Paracoccus litorisediminis]|uniref:Uncharacterized protein n=1 Tax=Paracoccus litorisediminis TaxID=2006130 RepID=A0A844HSI2_9RHOB|nr:hypothetical protein [Paracoccus litorisediminis]MTH62119.1 hypothetical protein [Paracoccus litorisediminis]
MKLFVLGSGSIATHDIALSTGQSIALFEANEPGGSAIVANLRGPSMRINWRDALGLIDWSDAISDTIVWAM